MKDEIIAEVWRNRDALAAKYNYDLDAIVAAIRERERRPLTRIVAPGKPNKPAELTAKTAVASLWQSRR